MMLIKCVFLTELGSVSTVNTEGLVAFVDLPDCGVENETVGAKLDFGYSINTFVVFVALSVVLILTVLFRASEFGSNCKADKLTFS
jgi:hypothetical protein